jgi:uncharacterized membrane protein YeaQ/YmgE (transglycosylase-associated protein family)
MVDFLIWIVLGIVAGSLAKVILPGPDPGGAGMTILLGIAGAFVGGFVGIFLPFLKPGASASITIGSIFTATVGAIIILFVYRKMKSA